MVTLNLVGSAHGFGQLTTVGPNAPADQAIPGALPGKEEAVGFAALGHVALARSLRYDEQLGDHSLL